MSYIIDVRTTNRAAIQAVILLLILASCAQEPGPFDAYVGVNLISVPSLAFSAAGKWALDDTSGIYMGFEDVSGTAGYEPPSANPGAEVFRLEIKNLIPDGDFTQIPVGSVPGGWELIDGPGIAWISPVLAVENVSGLLSGNVLHLTALDPTDSFRLSLRNNAAYGMRDGLLPYATYLPRFKYLTTRSGLVMEYNTAGIPTYVHTWKVGGGTDGADSVFGADFQCLNAFPTVKLAAQTFPSLYIESDADPYILFGSLENRQAQEAYIDDFRIVRTDRALHVRMTVAARGVTAQDLVTGCYRFSVYVKRDPSVGTPEGRNRFHAAGIGLTVKRTMGNATISAVRTFDDPDKDNDGGTALWKDWTLLSVDLANQSQDPDLATTTMELTITPTDDTDTGATQFDCGSILVSVPRLEMYPDGF